MIELLPGVFYIARAEYADPSLARGGYTSRDGVGVYLLRTDVAMHHSVSVDNDATPDIWETFPEIIAKSKYMQTVRWQPGDPRDLGPDNPYGHMLYPMPGGIICIVEGRGYNRTAAATKGHNTKAWPLVWMGNFQGGPLVDIRPWIPATNRFLGHVKAHECPNIVVIKPHRQYSEEDGRGYNACCGDDVIRYFDQFSLEGDMLAEDLKKKINEAAVVGMVTEKIRAGVPLTPGDKAWAIGVINAQDNAPPIA